jgi:hypothetical protein
MKWIHSTGRQLSQTPPVLHKVPDNLAARFLCMYLRVNLADSEQSTSFFPCQSSAHNRVLCCQQPSMEYINISGLRLDGRRPHEVRRVRSQLGLFPRADGSALLEMGHTKVMAVVHGPRESTHRSGSEHDAAVLECVVRSVASCVRCYDTCAGDNNVSSWLMSPKGRHGHSNHHA